MNREQVELTEELVNYLALYLEDELSLSEEHPTKTTQELIEDAIDAFNGGATL